MKQSLIVFTVSQYAMKYLPRTANQPTKFAPTSHAARTPRPERTTHHWWLAVSITARVWTRLEMERAAAGRYLPGVNAASSCFPMSCLLLPDLTCKCAVCLLNDLNRLERCLFAGTKPTKERMGTVLPAPRIVSLRTTAPVAAVAT